jgi:RNA-directed DNA polymerase
MTLNGLGMEKQPEKTFIGKIERGFEFLGYHFGPGQLAVALKTA